MGKYNLKVKQERVSVVPGKESLKRMHGESASVWRLVTFARQDWKLLVAGLASMLISTGTSLAGPALFGRVIDSLTKPSGDASVDSSALQAEALALIAVCVLEAIFSFLKSYLFNVAGERVVARLRKQLFHALMEMEIGFYDQSRVGELISRVTGDSTVLRDACTSQVSTLFKGVATVVGGFVYLFTVSWKLTLVILVLVPALAISARLYGRYAKALSKEVQQTLAEASQTAEEAMSNIRTVRSFAMEARQEALFGSRVDVTQNMGVRAAAAAGLFSGGTEGFTSLAFIAMLWYGGSLVLSGEMTTGVLTSFILYAIRIGGSMSSLAGLFGQMMNAVGASERVFQLLDRIPWVPASTGVTLGSIKGEIQFKHVTFAYPARKNAKVLQDFCLSIKAGHVAALVGPSGAGKSTIIGLIERFYDPDQGAVVIDDQDLKTVNGSSLRRQIGLVQQEPVLFAVSIRDNISFGRPDASEEEIIAAAKHANAHDFIVSFPEGYHTMVGERGVRLSGGQKQRVAIARAILQNPRILLLDEATSALDAESEHLVKEALDKLMIGRTTVIVAHRLSTVRQANQVAVIHRGAVAAVGTHDELLEISPLYARLVRRQMLTAEHMNGREAPGSRARGASGETGAAGGRVSAGTSPLHVVLSAKEVTAISSLPEPGDAFDLELDGSKATPSGNANEDEGDSGGISGSKQKKAKKVKNSKGRGTASEHTYITVSDAASAAGVGSLLQLQPTPGPSPLSPPTTSAMDYNAARDLDSRRGHHHVSLSIDEDSVDEYRLGLRSGHGVNESKFDESSGAHPSSSAGHGPSRGSIGTRGRRNPLIAIASGASAAAVDAGSFEAHGRDVAASPSEATSTGSAADADADEDLREDEGELTGLLH